MYTMDELVKNMKFKRHKKVLLAIEAITVTDSFETEEEHLKLEAQIKEDVYSVLTEESSSITSINIVFIEVKDL